MISSYNTSTQNLGIGENLIFATDRIVTGYTVAHTPGSDTFTFNKPGYYYVAFNGAGSTADAAGAVTVALLGNGVAIPGAEATEYSVAADEVVNLSFSTIIKVLPSCNCVDNSIALTIQNTGVASTITLANLVITKLC